jgi:hypothetical protein
LIMHSNRPWGEILCSIFKAVQVIIHQSLSNSPLSCSIHRYGGIEIIFIHPKHPTSSPVTTELAMTDRVLFLTCLIWMFTPKSWVKFWTYNIRCYRQGRLHGIPLRFPPTFLAHDSSQDWYIPFCSIIRSVFSNLEKMWLKSSTRNPDIGSRSDTITRVRKLPRYIMKQNVYKYMVMMESFITFFTWRIVGVSGLMHCQIGWISYCSNSYFTWEKLSKK